MRQAGTRDLYGYWRRIKGGRVAPEREEIEPAEIRSLLRDMFILGREDGAGTGHCWQFRLSGTRVSAMAGRELKGRAYAEWWGLASMEEGERLTAGVADDAFPVVAGVSGLSEHDGLFDLELLLLPLRHEGRLGRRVLGGIFPTPALAARPGQRLRDLRLISARTLLPIPEGQDDAAGLRPVPPAESTWIARRAGFSVIQGGLSA